MFEYVTIDVLANLIVMQRAAVDGAILISDDEEEARFYEACAHQDARIIPAPEIALLLLDRMKQRGIHGVVATFRGLGPQHNSPNAFRPSLGDVASLLLLSKGCDRVVRDICGVPWVTACEAEVGSMRRRVVEIARFVSRLRQACLPEHVGPVSLEYSDIIDWNTLEISWDRLIPSLLEKGVSRDTVQEIRNTQRGNDLRSDLLEFDGMDAVLLFAITSRMYRPRGIAASKEIQPAGFIGTLRMAYDMSEFEDDRVFWQMRRWERANPRYPLLRRWRALDPLGVVLDQRYWESDLSTIIGVLEPGEPLAMFKIDLDNFKQVNDELGHAAGDEAIRLYCKTVARVLGNVGEVYRRGGDEVVVLAPGLGETPARELAEKTRLEVEEVFRDWASARRLRSAPTASIGLAISNAEESRSQITTLADEAELQAKRQGKNRVVVLP